MNMEELFGLSGKNIVVTGAGGLLGKQHCIAIASAGGMPIMLDLSIQKLEPLMQELHARFGISGVGYAVDISNETQVEENVNQIFSEFGKLDGLVNNAANNPTLAAGASDQLTRLENFPIDQWLEDLAVGLTGSFLCSKHYGHLISQNSTGGSIVNISSDLGLIAPDQRLYAIADDNPKGMQPVKPITYSVVKAGIIGLTRYLASYWPDQNVRCNAICPGGVLDNQDEEFLTKVKATIPLGRLAYPNEYQGTLVWMLSKASSYLNGAIIPVDGGRTAW